MAVVAFLRDSQRDGISEHMNSQNNRHKLHLLSESVGQPLYAFLYPFHALPDMSPIAAGILEYINTTYLCQFLHHSLESSSNAPAGIFPKASVRSSRSSRQKGARICERLRSPAFRDSFSAPSSGMNHTLKIIWSIYDSGIPSGFLKTIRIQGERPILPLT